MNAIFVNTRPAERAERLTLAQAEITEFQLPLLALEACAFDDVLQRQMQHLPNVQVIVVVSPMAVQVGMQYLQQAGVSLTALQHIQWVAVGQKTAQCLAQFGIQAFVPDIENSEAMANVLLFQTSSPANVAFWRGEGGREWLMRHLQQQHWQVENICLYQRHLPVHAAQQWQQLKQQVQQQHIRQMFVLISSAMSWHYWQNLQQDDDFIANISGLRVDYLVLGERVAHIVSSHIAGQKQVHCHVLQGLQVNDIQQCVQSLLGEDDE